MEIIELTRELGRTIQEDPRYKTLRETSAACDKDEELQKMIGDFNLTRMNLSNMMNDPDQDQKKMQELNEQLTSVYEKVMQNEHMTAYNNANQELDLLLKRIKAILDQCAAGANPDTADYEENCTHNCSTCGGCH
jgi:cell fate (sporulation/competence/biofilm development) regulator YlbF (YheA/YmcA/DUF963 family)